MKRPRCSKAPQHGSRPTSAVESVCVAHSLRTMALLQNECNHQICCCKHRGHAAKCLACCTANAHTQPPLCTSCLQQGGSSEDKVLMEPHILQMSNTHTIVVLVRQLL